MSLVKQAWVPSLALSLAASCALSRPQLSSAPRQPNIIVIYADDHARAAVGAYGSILTETPNIDRLAREGTLFVNSFVGNSICGPSRGTLLTGLHSHAHGKTTNPAGFDDTKPTFATQLSAAGYRTGVVGKWHLPTDPRGFDHWALCGGYYNPEFRTADGKRPGDGYTTEAITRESLSWVDSLRAAGEAGAEDEAPFALWISHAATHRTWMPSPEHAGLFDDVVLPEPDTLFLGYEGRPAAEATQMRIERDLFPAYDLKLPVTGEGILDKAAERLLGRMNSEQREAWDAAYGPRNAAFLAQGLEGRELVRWKYQRYIKDYLRCVRAVDDSVGTVLAYLEESGLADDTIVIYTSDQGFFLGEHGWYDKRWMYEPALGTPLIARGPGVAAGVVREELVQNIDIAPTICALGAADPIDDAHGVSLVPLLRDEPVEGWRDAVYYRYFQRDSGRTSHTVTPHRGVRTARYKLIDVEEPGSLELYDLEQDPGEARNLAGEPDYAAILTDLELRLAELAGQYGDA